MHLIFLHGVRGVGKRTIATQLSRELGFPFLDFQNLVPLLGPVFGFASPNFHDLRDDVTDRLLTRALSLPEDGVIASFTDEATIPMSRYRRYIRKVRDSGGMGVFVGLTCDDEELRARCRTLEPIRHNLLCDLELLALPADSPPRERVRLPGPSITINTSGETPSQTVHNIIAMLPDTMKHGISI